MNEPLFISESSISLAWARAFLLVYDSVATPATPMIVSAGDFDGKYAPEIVEIREAVDTTLSAERKLSSKMNADLIFPLTLWNRSKHLGRDVFYNRYIEQYYPRLSARDRQRNGKGTYFLRMIGWGLPKKKSQSSPPFNQLEHIIQLYEDRSSHGQRPRSSALQLACFDPEQDHTKAVMRIFPCLHQLGLIYDSKDTLMLNAYYPSQFIFDRAYGNYLGLYNLGHFIATEIGATLRRITCFVGSPKLGKVTKGALRPLAERLNLFVQQAESNGDSEL